VSEDTWRTDVRYAALKDCSGPDLAWEFLRRNRDYQDEYRRSLEVASDGNHHADAARWARWGLSFRRRPKPVGEGTAGLLAT
jgi:hypothetical protein